MQQHSITSDTDFIQDSTYAIHFGAYRGLLSKLLKHDPAMFNLDKNDKIVDVGCGYGDLLKILRDSGYKNLMGIEPDRICRKSCLKDGLDVGVGTLSKTNLPNNFADVVIVNQVFHHIENYNNAVDEIARILKPKGLLCFIEPSPTLLRRVMDVLTFRTSLPKQFRLVRIRYEVMKLEMETGLYPNFLHQQNEFHSALARRFQPLWLHHGWFFQFGKYTKIK